MWPRTTCPGAEAAGSHGRERREEAWERGTGEKPAQSANMCSAAHVLPDQSHKTLESFDFDFNRRIDQALIRELATCRFVSEHANVLIAGPCGTGKSHISQALGHCAVRAGFAVLFTNHSKMLAALHAARATGTFERRFLALAKVDLLIVDDFALKPMISPHDEDIHDLIAERYECCATVVSSNLDFSEWGEVFPNRLLGAATLDRTREPGLLTTTPRGVKQEVSEALGTGSITAIIDRSLMVLPPRPDPPW
ncbi:MAG: ATP-binding protein [bacterium]|nr:ATP-binding protein [bacterium]